MKFEIYDGLTTFFIVLIVNTNPKFGNTFNCYDIINCKPFNSTEIYLITGSKICVMNTFPNETWTLVNEIVITAITIITIVFFCIFLHTRKFIFLFLFLVPFIGYIISFIILKYSYKKISNIEPDYQIFNLYYENISDIKFYINQQSFFSLFKLFYSIFFLSVMLIYLHILTGLRKIEN